MKPLLLPILISIFCFGSIAVYPKKVAVIKDIDFDLLKELKEKGEEEEVRWDKIEHRLFKDLKEGGKSDAEIHQIIGYVFLDADNQRGRAAVCFKKAVELDSTLYWSWYNLGFIHMDTEKGYNYFKKAIEAKPDFPTPYYWMAYYRCRNREDKKAIPVFEKYLEVAENDPDEANRVWVAKKVLKELHSGIEGKNLSMMRRQLGEKKK